MTNEELNREAAKDFPLRSFGGLDVDDFTNSCSITSCIFWYGFGDFL